jgi:hypothetical protein
MSSMNYSIGTAEKYDALPLLPMVFVSGGGIRLNSNIPLSSGDYVALCLKFQNLTESLIRFVTDSLSAVAPRPIMQVSTGATVLSNAGTAMSAVPAEISATTCVTHVCTATGGVNLGTMLMRGNNASPSLAFSSVISVVKGGAVVWQWLNQVSDYKTTPPDASIVGTINWYKLAANGSEISNFLTGTLLHNELTTTPPTQPVTVYVLDREEDVSMIQSTYNGQPVTISYQFAPVEGHGVFSFNDFSFNF